MKFSLSLLLFFGCCASTIPVFSQDTVYYDAARHETGAAKAWYFRLRTKSPAGWKVQDHFHSGKLQMTGGYADDSMHVSQGEFVWYDSTGAVIHRCTYVNNKLEGTDTFYYPGGQVQMAGDDKNDHADGEWIGYYPSGKISGKATYKNGEQVAGAFFNENGTPNTNVSIFRRDSQPPGGVSKWLSFLSKTVKYPDKAVMNNIKGTVIIEFKVLKQGKVTNVHVVASVEKSLDQEALRVMRASPDWEPAIYGGIISDSYRSQPITFTF